MTPNPTESLLWELLIQQFPVVSVGRRVDDHERQQACCTRPTSTEAPLIPKRESCGHLGPQLWFFGYANPIASIHFEFRR